jgi:peptide/nickel transport system ATP-binding protein
LSLLNVQGLSVAFGDATVVNDVSFTIAPGEKFALVGESGSGKTVTALSALRLNQDARYQGSILFNGEDILKMSEPALRRLRGKDAAMIFQEPMTALNPLFSIGNQIAEVLMLHEGLSAKAAAQRTVQLLDKTGIPEPARRALAYPHQLSGGQRQRAMIAMALACRPKLLIADEPTTALDVTIQRQILELIRGLVAERGMALILISHDLGVVAQNVSKVAVMYGGEVVEDGPTASVFANPMHPYTLGLFGARPRLGAPRGGRLVTIAGTVPELVDLPPGCPFAGRCRLTIPECLVTPPPTYQVDSGHHARCIRLDAVRAEKAQVAA